MAEITIVYWRDIPSMVMAGRGRKAAKVQLPERFEQAIDRAAMKAGAKDEDAYLADWRREGPVTVEGDDDMAARTQAARLDADYDDARLKALIANDGRA